MVLNKFFNRIPRSIYSIYIKLSNIFLGRSMNTFSFEYYICSYWVLAIIALYEIHIRILLCKLRVIVFAGQHTIFLSCFCLFFGLRDLIYCSYPFFKWYAHNIVIKQIDPFFRHDKQVVCNYHSCYHINDIMSTCCFHCEYLAQANKYCIVTPPSQSTGTKFIIMNDARANMT